MINLALTTDKLSLISSSAATLDVHVSYVEASSSTFAVNGIGKQNTAISSATTTDILGVPGASTIRNCKTINIRNKDSSLSCTVTVQFNANGTLYELHKAVVAAGECLEYVEGIGWFLVTSNLSTLLMKALNADDTGGQAVNTAQPWFPTAGAVTVAATTTYRMRGLLKITSGATSHSTGLSFGGTASLTSIGYYAQAHRSAADTIISVFSGINIISAANATVDVAGTQVGHYIQINGIIRINGGGTLIPQFTFSVNPTGTITIKKDTFFELQALGDNTFTTSGTWA